MTTLEALVAVRELLADESRWCKGLFAADEKGFPAAVDDPFARKWCLSGAIEKVAGNGTVVSIELRRSLELNGCCSRFNDTHTHAEVLALIDRAIARQKKSVDTAETS